MSMVSVMRVAPVLGMRTLAAIVGKRGGQPKAADTMVCPCQPLSRRFMDNHELAGGVYGMGTEINGGTVEAVPGGETGV